MPQLLAARLLGLRVVVLDGAAERSPDAIRDDRRVRFSPSSTNDRLGRFRTRLPKRLAGKAVLVTGGLGFIGSTLAHALVEIDCRVRLVDSLIPTHGGSLHNIAGIEDRVEVDLFDIRDSTASPKGSRGRRSSSGSQARRAISTRCTDPATDLDINCRAQLALLEACRQHNPGVRLVFASTRQLYGRPRYLPVDEAHPLEPVDVNGINKLAGELFHLLYGRTYGIDVSVLRLTNTYGPRMRVRDARQTFLGVWIRAALNGRGFPRLRRRIAAPRLHLCRRRGVGALPRGDVGGCGR